MSKRSLPILVVVATCVLLGPAWPRPVQAEVTGKLDVLKTVAAQHRKNKEALRTWRGTAVVEDLVRGDPTNPQSQVENVEFVLDRSAAALRWKSIVRGAVVEHSDGRVERLAELKVHGLRAGGTFHELTLTAGKDQRPYTVYVRDAEESEMGRGAYRFDPMHFSENVEADLAARVTYFAERARDISHPWVVKRDGDLVTIEVTYPLPDERKQQTSRYVIDLSRGASLRSFHSGNARSEAVWEYEYEFVGGVWVLKRSVQRSSTATNAGGAFEPELLKRATFSDSKVNEPIEPREFTPEAIGVQPTDTIKDERAAPLRNEGE